MALIICSECGKQVSDKALTCPNCGNPIQKQVLEERKMNQKINCCTRCGVSGSSAWWKKVADGTHCVFCNSTSVIASGLTRKEILEAREAEDSSNYDHDNPDPVNDWIVRNVAILSTKNGLNSKEKTRNYCKLYLGFQKKSVQNVNRRI